MTDTPRLHAPPIPDALTFNDDGTITMTIDGDVTRFGALPLGVYGDVVDIDMAVEAWIGGRGDTYRERRTEIESAPKTDRPAMIRELNATKRRDDVEWKQRNADVFTQMMSASNPSWTPPDPIPQWFGTPALVRTCLNHWDSTPFRGLARTRANDARANGNDPTT